MIVFGKTVDLNRNVFLPTSDQSQQAPLHEWLEARLSAQKTIIKKAQEIQLERNTSRLSSANNALTSYAVGSYVLVEYPRSEHHSGPPSKMMTNLRGPMKVVSKKGSAYSVMDLTTNTVEVMHLKRLRPFYFDPELTDPRQVANADRQYFDIDKILSHSGAWTKYSKMKFQVQWKPISEASQPSVTWEPWRLLRTTVALHLYLRERNMGRLIPRQFRNGVVA
jgi:hypothetical protein